MPRRGVKARDGGRRDARALAHEVLVRVETTAAFADVLLAERLAGTEIPAADRALATRLVYGTLAWQGRLDHHLARFLRGPLATLEPGVRAALRLGTYQLLMLDRVPAYAAVDSSVRLVRAGGRGVAGLVNAVLRRAAATPEALPDPAVDALERLAVEWSHPRWLVERWTKEIGAEELPRLLAADNARGATTLRANPLRTTRDALLAELVAADVDAVAAGRAPDGVVVRRGAARLRALPGWHAGRFAFQGEASQLVTALLGVHAGARVLDACAAPGGKTAHAAALVGPTGRVTALDRHLAGARRIRVEVARLAAATLVDVVVADACRPPAGRSFDAVLVDAPCSGLGTLRRHPELRWRRRPEDVPRLAALQRAILGGVAPCVRPGGVLVYAVCTIAREENEDVIAAFRRDHPRFAVDQSLLPADLATPDGFLRTLPHRHDLDGFFAARLRARA
jgi:16S rRNA (cytosine967-C5)-methyltransferase